MESFFNLRETLSRVEDKKQTSSQLECLFTKMWTYLFVIHFLIFQVKSSQDYCSKDDLLCSVQQIQDSFSRFSNSFVNFTKPKNVDKLVKFYKKNHLKIEKEISNDGIFTKKVVKLDICNCDRKIVVNIEEEFDFQQKDNFTTCSQHAFLRGPNQKVVSYSYYGDPNSRKSQVKQYFNGIFKNYNAIQEFYPNWIMRLYHDLDPNDEQFTQLCEFACKNPNFDLCHTKNIPGLGNVQKLFPMNWRFLPTLDSQVSYFMSRDLDSLIYKREVAAVQEWWKSKKSFHIMRDHPRHKTAILGGMWGIKLRHLERYMMVSSFHLASHDPILYAMQDSHNDDQTFLLK